MHGGCLHQISPFHRAPMIHYQTMHVHATTHTCTFVLAMLGGVCPMQRTGTIAFVSSAQTDHKQVHALLYPTTRPPVTRGSRSYIPFRILALRIYRRLLLPRLSFAAWKDSPLIKYVKYVSGLMRPMH